MFWKSCQSSTYVKLRVELCGALVKEAEEHNLVSDIKRHIAKFDTVLLHSNWSSSRRKHWSKISTDMKVLSCGPKASNIWRISDAISPRYIRKNPRSMYARVPHGMAQFVQKMEKLPHIIGTALILEMARAYASVPDYGSWYLSCFAFFPSDFRANEIKTPRSLLSWQHHAPISMISCRWINAQIVTNKFKTALYDKLAKLHSSFCYKDIAFSAHAEYSYFSADFELKISLWMFFSRLLFNLFQRRIELTQRGLSRHIVRLSG